jgi:hypothetical protein
LSLHPPIISRRLHLRPGGRRIRGRRRETPRPSETCPLEGRRDFFNIIRVRPLSSNDPYTNAVPAATHDRLFRVALCICPSWHWPLRWYEHISGLVRDATGVPTVLLIGHKDLYDQESTPYAEPNIMLLPERSVSAPFIAKEHSK